MCVESESHTFAPKFSVEVDEAVGPLEVELVLKVCHIRKLYRKDSDLLK